MDDGDRNERRHDHGEHLDFFDIKGVKCPVGVSAFRYQLYQAPESWSKQAHPKLVYYKRHPIGGHFAAWEQPQLFSEDVRATFHSFQTANASQIGVINNG